MFINDKVWRVHEVKWLREKGVKGPDSTLEGEILRPQPNPMAESSRPQPVLMDIDEADELSTQAVPPAPIQSLPPTVRPPARLTISVTGGFNSNIVRD